MNYWIITDTHFGHENIVSWCQRPADHEARMMKNLKSTVRENDILIHLGDVAWRDIEHWHMELLSIKAKRKWLVRGNHDKKSILRYLDYGWDFCADSFSLNMYGKNILFSHKPQIDSGYDINIHGHFHNADHRRHEPELVAIKNDKQVLLMVEHDYRPFSLRKICEISS